MVDAVHEACQVMVHVVKDHVDAALEVVALVRCACTPALASAICAFLLTILLSCPSSSICCFPTLTQEMPDMEFLLNKHLLVQVRTALPYTPVGRPPLKTVSLSDASTTTDPCRGQLVAEELMLQGPGEMKGGAGRRLLCERTISRKLMMLAWCRFLSSLISRMAVMGKPSFSVSILIFFSATSSPFCLSVARYTCACTEIFSCLHLSLIWVCFSRGT